MDTGPNNSILTNEYEKIGCSRHMTTVTSSDEAVQLPVIYHLLFSLLRTKWT